MHGRHLFGFILFYWSFVCHVVCDVYGDWVVLCIAGGGYDVHVTGTAVPVLRTRISETPNGKSVGNKTWYVNLIQLRCEPPCSPYSGSMIYHTFLNCLYKRQGCIQISYPWGSYTGSDTRGDSSRGMLDWFMGICIDISPPGFMVYILHCALTYLLVVFCITLLPALL